MEQSRPGKRVRSDGRNGLDTFFGQSDEGSEGTYLKIKLLSGKPLKKRGWPWIQVCMRGILGDRDKVEKASLLSDGSLLLKTKNKKQTEKLLKATIFGDTECEVERDERLNSSKGTIHAYDLEDLTESEVVGWLSEFGVVGARRFTRKVGGKVENTPTILLTFDRSTCPTKLELDYVTYHVHQYFPNPMLCFRCGLLGHIEVFCKNRQVCLRCGGDKHEGGCEPKCINCQETGHACLARVCEKWKKEKEILKIKTEQEISYVQAKRLYEKQHAPPVLRAYSAAVRVPSASVELKEKVEKLEQTMEQVLSLLQQMQKQTMKGGSRIEDCVVEKDSSGDVANPPPVVDDGVRMDDDCEGVESGAVVVRSTEDDAVVVCDTETLGDGGMIEVVPESPDHVNEASHDVGQVGKWKTPAPKKKQKQKKKQTKATTGEDEDEISPSPVLVRPSRGSERHANKVQPGTRKSWSDG